MRRVWAVGVVLLVAAAAAAAWAVWSRQTTGGEQDLVAWWAGLPKASLVQSGPDRVMIPPRLAPPNGVAHRFYKLAPDAEMSPAKPQLDHVWLMVGRRCVVAAWNPPANAKQRAKPLTQQQAQKVAEQFLRSRGLLAGARLVKADVACEDKHGRVTAYRFRFRVQGAERPADVTIHVDPRYGFVSLASYHEQLPPNLSQQPLVSAEEARAKVVEAAKKDGLMDIEVKGWILWGRELGFPPGHPVYAFDLVGKREIGPGHFALVRERWIVDGIDGRVGTGGDFPEKREFSREWTRYLMDQAKKKQGGQGAGK